MASIDFTFKLRRGLAAEWTADNPVLADGEPGVELDTGKFKVGDGVHTWSALHYFIDVVQIQALIDAAVIAGVQGPAGDSAYQVAVNNGFVGTQSQWLASLVGPQGPTGATGATGATGPTGPTGPAGADGTSYTGPKITAASTAPSTPTSGDVWIDLSS